MTPRSKGRDYYTLVQWYPEHNRWAIVFGDYSKSVVKGEADDYHYGHGRVKRKHMQIIKTSDLQADINIAVRLLAPPK